MKTYILHGKPKPLQRARVTRYRTYDPQSEEKAKDRLILREQRGNVAPISDGPLDLVVTFFMKIPKSTSKKDSLNGKYHVKRPDLDNLLKYILDVAQGVLIKDDSLVSSIIADKIYDNEPRTEFTFREV